MLDVAHSCGSVTIDPPAGAWGAPLRAARIDDRARRFREQLGLPTDRPLIMTGHQAQIWHAGILAKYLAVDAACRRFDASPAWIVVDQDTNDWGSIRYPVRLPRGRIIARTWRLSAASAVAPGGEAQPTGVGGSFTPTAVPVLAPGESFPGETIEPGLQQIHGALVASRGAATVAAQMHGALADMLARWITPAPVVYATDLAQTDLFAWMVGRMRDDPAACVRAYNAAVHAHPRARVLPLAASEVNDIFELPLWHIDERGTRRRVYEHELDGIPPAQLAPRAAMMTGLLRLAGCELFVAGTGGGGPHGYERVVESWLSIWLDERPAPEVVVSATASLADDGSATQPDAARATWLAHHARHDPGAIGDRSAAARKRAMVNEIARVREAGGDAAPLFRQMQAMLSEFRVAHAASLADLNAEAEATRASLAGHRVLADRTWAFPLLGRSSLDALAELVRRPFDAP